MKKNRRAALVIFGVVPLLCICLSVFALNRPDTPATEVPPTNTAQATDVPATLAPTDVPATAEPTADLLPVAEQGEFQMVLLVQPEFSTNREVLLAASKKLCGNADFCKLLIWNDVAYIPESLPMTDEQLAKQIADYSRNRNTGLDELCLMDSVNLTCN
jgi:hypothetical protein